MLQTTQNARHLIILQHQAELSFYSFPFFLHNCKTTRSFDQQNSNYTSHISRYMYLEQRHGFHRITPKPFGPWKYEPVAGDSQLLHTIIDTYDRTQIWEMNKSQMTSSPQLSHHSKNYMGSPIIKNHITSPNIIRTTDFLMNV